MNSTESELSWPTTTTPETNVICCIPWRRAPKSMTTTLHVNNITTDIEHKPRAQTKLNDNPKFIMLFNPEIPMTPNLARSDSKYVVEGFFFDSVKKEAYVIDVNGKPQVPCKAILNESFIPSGKRKRLMYIGFQYPDGTSLPYVPICDVTVQHRSAAMSHSQSLGKGGRRLSAVYGKDYVYLSIPRVVYFVLVKMAEDVFNGHVRDTKSLLPDAEIRGDRVWLFNTEMKASCKVEGKVSGRRYAKTVYQALKELGGNLEGDALMYMRFCEDLCPGDSEMKLQFRLHRMMVKGISRY